MKSVHSFFRSFIHSFVHLFIHSSIHSRRLLDKQQRVEAIAASLEQNGADESQLAEIQEIITPPEKEQLKKVKHLTNK